MSLIIRDIVAADLDQWQGLWAQYNAFYGRSGAAALDAAVVQSTWARILDPGEPVHGLVAERGGRLAGLAHFIFHRNTITIEDTCYLQDLFADPGQRGQGIGRALMEGFFARAARAGTVGVYWHTHASNDTAMRLYDRMAANTEFVVYRHRVDTDPE